MALSSLLIPEPMTGEDMREMIDEKEPDGR